MVEVNTHSHIFPLPHPSVSAKAACALCTRTKVEKIPVLLQLLRVGALLVGHALPFLALRLCARFPLCPASPPCNPAATSSGVSEQIN